MNTLLNSIRLRIWYSHNSLICRLFHKPIPYPLASWGYWHYSHCGRCGVHRWGWADRVSGWFRGYKFGNDPNHDFGIQIIE